MIRKHEEIRNWWTFNRCPPRRLQSSSVHQEPSIHLKHPSILKSKKEDSMKVNARYGRYSAHTKTISIFSSCTKSFHGCRLVIRSNTPSPFYSFTADRWKKQSIQYQAHVKRLVRSLARLEHVRRSDMAVDPVSMCERSSPYILSSSPLIE